jgi:hypothetical protein
MTKTLHLYSLLIQRCCIIVATHLVAAMAYIQPQAGPPGSQVTVLGRPNWYIKQACNSAAAETNVGDCLSAILFQDYRCR